MRLPFATLVWLLVAGCVIPPANLEGRACSVDHPCAPEWSCVEEVCLKQRSNGGTHGPDALGRCPPEGRVEIQAFSSKEKGGALELTWEVSVTGTELGDFRLLRDGIAVEVLQSNARSYRDTASLPNRPVGYILEARDLCGTILATKPHATTTPATAGSGATVELLRPENNSVFAAPVELELEAVVETHGDKVTQVSFFAGATALCARIRTPYECTGVPISQGDFPVRAEVTFASGRTLQSTTKTIRVRATPEVAISRPASKGSSGRRVTFQAKTNPVPGRAISRIEFQENGITLCTASGSSTQCTWNDAPLGEHSVIAKVTDRTGAVGVSALHTFEVQNLAALVDDFDGSALDAAVWSATETNGSIGVANGRLELRPNPNSTGVLRVLTVQRVEMTLNAFVLQVREVPEGATGALKFSLDLAAPATASQGLDLGVKNGKLTATARPISGVATVLGEVTFQPATMSWWRIRHAANGWMLDYASSSTGPWTQLGTVNFTFPTNNLLAHITVEFDASAAPGRGIVDNINAL